MKKLLITILLFILILKIGYTQGTVRKTSQWKSYEGKLVKGKSKENIETNILFLNEGYIVGSFKELNIQQNHKIVGQLKNDTLILTIRNHSTDSVEGLWIATLQNRDKVLQGTFQLPNGLIIGKFKLRRAMFSSYTNYLTKFRALKEYKTIDDALKNPKDVLSIDFASQKLTSLPNDFTKLKKLISVNLLGNKFKEFPIVLTKLKTIEEISLSSNGLEKVSPDIGNLKNLRVLILNFNELTELPKEIGKLTNLLYLDIGDNRLKTIPEEIKNLTKLQELHVDDNLLSEPEKERLKKLLPNCTIHYK